MIENPFFIVGAARSGTTFLGQALNRHSQIHCLVEWPDTFNYAIRLAMMHPSDRAEDFLDIRDRLRVLYYDAWRKDVARVGDKSHQHVLNVLLLRDSFLSPQFIHVIRDGRDVVASMLEHKGVLSWFSEAHINANARWPSRWFGVQDADHYGFWRESSLTSKCVLRWKAWVRAGLEAEEESKHGLFGNTWLTVHYEDLMCHPEEQGQRILDFLGVRYETVFGDAKTNSIGRWKRDLEAQQLRDVQVEAGPLLVRLGYHRWPIR